MATAHVDLFPSGGFLGFVFGISVLWIAAGIGRQVCGWSFGVARARIKVAAEFG